MLLDVAGSEIVLVAVVALVVLGPEELLPLMRRIGRWMGKIQGQINHWRWQLHNESIIESGLGIDPRLDPMAETPKPVDKPSPKTVAKDTPKLASSKPKPAPKKSQSLDKTSK
ncbi:MAG: hypothetical protein FJX22_02935 [Alphaproteobacteria bacterium]|nr:hypothetical protein [Alphaproteobacteria bacterium]